MKYIIRKYWWIFLAVSVIVFLLAAISEWNDDAIAYSFFIPLTGEDESFIPITSISDIWHSQINHYFNSNGRFVVHFIVQIFCGLLGKYWFAVCNAIVWGILLYVTASFAKKQISTSFLLIVSSLLIILFASVLPFTPPFQINYVWTACAILLWTKLFFTAESHKFSSTDLPVSILLAIFSFLTGELHEGFSIPYGAAIIYYACCRRFRLSSRQWTMAVFFGIGALVSILAPGNFWRLNEQSGGEHSIIYLVESIPNILWMPLILLLLIRPFKNFRLHCTDIRIKFFLAVISISLIFNIILGSFGRGILVYNLALIMVLFIYLSENKINVLIVWVSILAAMIVLGFRIYNIEMQNQKTIAILNEYEQSETGNIFIEDKLFLYNHLETTQRRNTYTNKMRQQNPVKEFLKIYPVSMENVEFMKDTNMIVRISDQSWVCIQSGSNPKNFVVSKTLLPGLLNRRMADRILDFNSKNPIFIDSTATYRSLLYINDRPYIRASVSISD